LTAPRCLIVLAHPLRESLAARLAEVATDAARAAGWEVTRCDLYAEGFDPRLSLPERASYYTGFDGSAVAAEQAELAATEILILVFPTWWFGFPAILKGWFDRVWAPGTAYDHAPDLRMMRPRLANLREVLAVTTLGAPAWVDRLILRRPLRRILRWAIVRPCAPQARVTWRALYKAETLDAPKLARFEARLRADINAIARRLPCPE
jgi:putative NADPH-quinone reductase